MEPKVFSKLLLYIRPSVSHETMSSLSILPLESVKVGEHLICTLGTNYIRIITHKMKQTHKIVFLPAFAGSTVAKNQYLCHIPLSIECNLSIVLYCIVLNCIVL